MNGPGENTNGPGENADVPGGHTGQSGTDSPSPVRPEEDLKPQAEDPSRRAATAHGFAYCEKPERYIQQIVSHWSHKMATSYDAEARVGAFPFSETENAVMAARPDGIAITLVTGGQERNVHMRGVIERHIDRFAFREAPLKYEWNEQ
jgi:hypothetical protein